MAPPTSATPPVFLPAGDIALPANAQAGKCYARAFEDPTYQTETKKSSSAKHPDGLNLFPLNLNLLPWEGVAIAAEDFKEKQQPANRLWSAQAVGQNAAAQPLVCPAIGQISHLTNQLAVHTSAREGELLTLQK